MSHKYGIKICREVLLYLASDSPIDERIGNAFSEIGLFNGRDDTSVELHMKIKTWKNKYRSLQKSDLVISKAGDLESIQEVKKKQYLELSTEMVWICTEIIEFNSQISSNNM